MKQMRLHIYLILGFFLLTFILGSFFDLELSKAIFSSKNAFGLTISIIGTLLGYACLSLCGGGLLGLALHKAYPRKGKVFLYLFSGIAFVVSIYYAGREFFGPNGFTNEKLVWLGYLLALPFLVGAGYLGYLIAKRSDNKMLLNILIILLIAMFIALVPGVSLLKSIFHRPRYRTLSDPLYSEITFHNWYERCSNYKELMSLYSLTSEEFKSFPSGHAGAASVVTLTITFSPMFDSRIKKNHLIYFYFSFLFILLVSFSRILVGAHFLSDVSMGALITTLVLLVTNEIVIKQSVKFEQTHQKQ